MNNGRQIATDGVSYGVESLLAREVSERLFQEKASGLDLRDVHSPEDYERAAQAAWLARLTNEAGLKH